MTARLALLLTLTALACRAREEPACGDPLAARVAVFDGSRVRSSGAVERGRVRACREEPELFAAVVGALRRMPSDLAPASVVLHIDARWETVPAPAAAIQFHRPSRTLLVERRAPARLDGTIWLHELVHVSAAGARPSSSLSSRVHEAVEEGIADYTATVLEGTPRVGGEASGEVRDLTRPPRVRASDWARLALGAPFPAHAFGHALAAELWRLPARPHPSELVLCLTSERPFPDGPSTPRAVVEELLARCPERGQRALAAALESVIPSELLSD